MVKVARERPRDREPRPADDLGPRADEALRRLHRRPRRCRSTSARRGARPRRPERRRQDDDAPLPRRHHRAVAAARSPSPGHDIQRDPIEAKRALAFIPDEPHLFDYLTVEEHLRFIARLYGVADVDARMPALLDELELDGQAPSRCPASCRAACGRSSRSRAACCTTPSVLILDEPLTGLDPGGMRRMRETIAARAAAGAAVILSSHLLHLVEELCTKLLVSGAASASRTARSTRSSPTAPGARRPSRSRTCSSRSPATRSRPA